MLRSIKALMMFFLKLFAFNRDRDEYLDFENISRTSFLVLVTNRTEQRKKALWKLNFVIKKSVFSLKRYLRNITLNDLSSFVDYMLTVSKCLF